MGESDFESSKKNIERKFRRVFNEVELVRSKIYEKKGWIFTSHVYSKEELSNSPHHEKIYSITEKIGDDAENWYKRNKLCDAGKEFYHDRRDDVETELHFVNMEISRRQPTWWESFKGAMENFVVSVMSNMPMLKRILLTTSRTLAKLPGPLGYIGSMVFGGLDSVTKKLTAN